MPHLEKMIAEQNYEDDKKYNIKPTGQRGHESESEEEVRLDLRENSIGKASLVEATIFSAEKQLSSDNNFEIINKLLGRDDAAQELEKKFEIFINKLGSKNIIHNNSAEELIKISTTCLFLSCARVKKITASLAENKKLNFEEKIKKEQTLKINQNALMNEFEILNNYLDLLTKKEFEAVEKEELGTKLGFLKNHLIREKLRKLGYKINDKKEYEQIEVGVEHEIKMLRSTNKAKYISLIKKFSQDENINTHYEN